MFADRFTSLLKSEKYFQNACVGSSLFLLFSSRFNAYAKCSNVWRYSLMIHLLDLARLIYVHISIVSVSRLKLASRNSFSDRS